MNIEDYNAGVAAGIKATTKFVFKLFMCTVIFVVAVAIGTIISAIIYPI